MADDIAKGSSSDDAVRTGDGAFGADFAILVVGAARTVTDRLDAAVANAGIDDMRSAFGYVIRALAGQDRTLTELADLLGVTKQSAIKIVDEMERRDLLSREPHPTDRRAKVLALTARGRTVRAAALRESQAMEAELRASVGDEATDALMRGLLAFLVAHGDADAASEGRARANW